MKTPNRLTGFILVILGSTFWGVGGTVSQKLFQQIDIEVNWLVTTRLLVAGILLLGLQLLGKNRSQVMNVWRKKQTALSLIIFGSFGMLAVQYTYMASISYGNAAVATLLQYLSPAMIIVYMVLRKQSVLTGKDIITVSLALTGCFLLLTNGSISQLSVPTPAIVWGILSGLAAAFYTLYAVNLLKQFDSLVIVGWAMVIGGCLLSFINPPWRMDYTSLTLESSIYLLFVIIFGTMLAFWFYIKSLESLAPKETSLLGSLEPLAAVFTTVLWLHVPFGFFQWIGTLCIFGMILMLTLGKESNGKKLNKRQQAVS